MANADLTTIMKRDAVPDLGSGAAAYEIIVDGRQIAADPRDKGEPGDIVVVWPKRRSPRLLRRLARCQPFDKYFFSELDTGATTAVPCNKVSAIHRVIEAHTEWEPAKLPAGRVL